MVNWKGSTILDWDRAKTTCQGGASQRLKWSYESIPSSQFTGSNPQSQVNCKTKTLNDHHTRTHSLNHKVGQRSTRFTPSSIDGIFKRHLLTYSLYTCLETCNSRDYKNIKKPQEHFIYPSVSIIKITVSVIIFLSIGKNSFNPSKRDQKPGTKLTWPLRPEIRSVSPHHPHPAPLYFRTRMKISFSYNRLSSWLKGSYS